MQLYSAGIAFVSVSYFAQAEDHAAAPAATEAAVAPADAAVVDQAAKDKASAKHVD